MNRLQLFRKYYLTKNFVTDASTQKQLNVYSEPINLIDFKKQIQTNCDNCTVVETFDYNETKYEILQVEIIQKVSCNKLLIFAGVHGDEFAATLAVIDVLADIKSNPSFYVDWNIRILAPLNPVGSAFKSRYNEQCLDINRDFRSFKTIGARVQKKAIEEFKPDIIISMHEGPQNGFFVIGDGEVPKDLQERVSEDLSVLSVQLAKKSFLGMSVKDGFWRKGRLTYFAQKLLGIYTLGRYAHDNNLALLTTESCWQSKDIRSRSLPHLAVVRSVVSQQRKKFL
jgi:Succinylglutamate desuccinylase / Aspartoacylase family